MSNLVVRYTKHVRKRKLNPGRQEVTYNGIVKHLQPNERIFVVNQTEASRIGGALSCMLMTLETAVCVDSQTRLQFVTLMNQLSNYLPAEKAYETQDILQEK